MSRHANSEEHVPLLAVTWAFAFNPVLALSSYHVLPVARTYRRRNQSLASFESLGRFLPALLPQ